jgi:Zn finger protein HypA/HybF involved in hydrogenase expression
MTLDRIKEIQAETAYPNSTSVQQALLKIWNECQQEQVKNCSIPDVVGQSEQLCPNCGSDNTELADKDNDNQCNYCKWIWA